MDLSQSITRKSASNLALAFIVLPREKRHAMARLYAFCREIDDIADAPDVSIEVRRRQLAAWRKAIDTACRGEEPQIPVARELQPVITHYHLPRQLLHEIIDGVEMDLDVHLYSTYDELEQYCYRVASAVGLLSLEIFGYEDPICRDYAVDLGKALQLTNILRDVGRDADRGRIYLPEEELERFGVSREEILAKKPTTRFRELAASVAERARSYYQRSRDRLPESERPRMVAAELMAAVYWRLLNKIAASGFNVFAPQKIRVGKAEKLWLITRALCQSRIVRLPPAYGAAPQQR